MKCSECRNDIPKERFRHLSSPTKTCSDTCSWKRQKRRKKEAKDNIIEDPLLRAALKTFRTGGPEDLMKGGLGSYNLQPYLCGGKPLSREEGIKEGVRLIKERL